MHKPCVHFHNHRMMQSWLRDLFLQHFELVQDTDSAVLAIDWRLPNVSLIEPLARPTVFLCFWDAYLDQTTTHDGLRHDLFARDWIWIHEHHYALSQNWDAVPCSLGSSDRFMLMLMNLRRDHRDLAQQTFARYLDDSLWTYLNQGKCLPEDPVPVAMTVSPGGFDQRRYVKSWYDSTAFSMVIESRVEDRLFVSEKSFKPIQHGHPFVIYGPALILDYLHSLGFATFDSEINELYDAIPNTRGNYHHYPAPVADLTTNRLDAIARELDRLYLWWKRGRNIFRDPVTIEKIQHNRDRFYDHTHIQQLMHQQIIAPLFEIIESAP